jgi:hypothetical protein
VVVLILLYIWQLKRRVQRGFDEAAANDLLLPVYWWVAVWFAVTYFADGLYIVLWGVVVDADKSNHFDGVCTSSQETSWDCTVQSALLAAELAFRRVLIDGTTLFFMHHGAGKRSQRHTLLWMVPWATFVFLTEYLWQQRSDIMGDGSVPDDDDDDAAAAIASRDGVATLGWSYHDALSDGESHGGEFEGDSSGGDVGDDNYGGGKSVDDMANPSFWIRRNDSPTFRMLCLSLEVAYLSLLIGAYGLLAFAPTDRVYRRPGLGCSFIWWQLLTIVLLAVDTVYVEIVGYGSGSRKTQSMACLHYASFTFLQVCVGPFVFLRALSQDSKYWQGLLFVDDDHGMTALTISTHDRNLQQNSWRVGGGLLRLPQQQQQQQQYQQQNQQQRSRSSSMPTTPMRSSIDAGPSPLRDPRQALPHVTPRHRSSTAASERYLMSPSSFFAHSAADKASGMIRQLSDGMRSALGLSDEDDDRRRRQRRRGSGGGRCDDGDDSATSSSDAQSASRLAEPFLATPIGSINGSERSEVAGGATSEEEQQRHSSSSALPPFLLQHDVDGVAQYQPPTPGALQQQILQLEQSPPQQEPPQVVVSFPTGDAMLPPPPAVTLTQPLLGHSMNTTAAQQLAETLEQLSAEPRCAFLHFGLLSIDTRLQDTHPAADVLGTGGAAKVYRGRLRGNKPVAIKMIWSVDITAEIVRQFKAEVMMLARLARHRNVVQVEGYSVMPPALCVVMELCNRGSLFDLFSEARDSELIRAAHEEQIRRRRRLERGQAPPRGRGGERERVRGSVESAGGSVVAYGNDSDEEEGRCFLVANLDDDPSGTGVGAGAFYNDDNNEEDDWLGDYRRRPSVASSVGPPQQPRPQPQPQPQLQPPRQCVNSAVVETARRRAAAAAATARERQRLRREERWERREQERKAAGALFNWRRLRRYLCCADSNNGCGSNRGGSFSSGRLSTDDWSDSGVSADYVGASPFAGGGFEQGGFDGVFDECFYESEEEGGGEEESGKEVEVRSSGSQRTNRRRFLSCGWETRLQMACECAEAVAFLHMQSPPVLHKDIKSPNVLVVESVVSESDTESEATESDSFSENESAAAVSVQQQLAEEQRRQQQSRSQQRGKKRRKRRRKLEIRLGDLGSAVESLVETSFIHNLRSTLGQHSSVHSADRQRNEGQGAGVGGSVCSTPSSVASASSGADFGAGGGGLRVAANAMDPTLISSPRRSRSLTRSESFGSHVDPQQQSGGLGGGSGSLSTPAPARRLSSARSLASNNSSSNSASGFSGEDGGVGSGVHGGVGINTTTTTTTTTSSSNNSTTGLRVGASEASFYKVKLHHDRLAEVTPNWAAPEILRSLVVEESQHRHRRQRQQRRQRYRQQQERTQTSVQQRPSESSFTLPPVYDEEDGDKEGGRSRTQNGAKSSASGAGKASFDEDDSDDSNDDQDEDEGSDNGANNVNSSSPYTTASDVYSLGIVLWELLTLEVPFDDASGLHEMIYRVGQNGETPPLPPDKGCYEESNDEEGIGGGRVNGDSDGRRRCGSSGASGASSSAEGGDWGFAPAGYMALLRCCWRRRPSRRPAALEVAERLREMQRVQNEARREMRRKKRRELRNLRRCRRRRQRQQQYTEEQKEEGGDDNK